MTLSLQGLPPEKPDNVAGPARKKLHASRPSITT